ncbi:MAG TPA: hypothetical protein VIF37_14875 [Methylobacter sp.]|jgi:hypothetical protein
MPIPVQNNAQYGGNLINQKYAPLAINAVAIDNAVQAEYVALFQRRIALLNGQGILPRQLNLYAANWGAIQAAEANAATLRPIVVVSSNRAEWIHHTYTLANELEPLDGNFNDVTDVRALVAGPTAWYLPKRINNANRHVYIVVHRKEYAYYQAQLNGTGMTVIGWEFDINRVVEPGGIVPRDKTYVGFGASRFAALEFCKYVFNTLIAPALPAARQKAWLVDDNVTYVRAFPGFTETEAVMNAGIWGLGFTGATQNSTDQEVRDLAATPAANLGAPQQQGLLQQCVLWNINELNAQHLNYSPYFVTSNEDTSLSSFLQGQAASRLRLVTGATVVKANPTHDNSPGAKLVAQLRDTAVANYYDIENAVQVNGGADIDLSDYITGTVLRNAQQNVRRQWPIYPESIAVEQLMAKIVADRLAWVPALIFRPNGAAPQPTQRF